MYQVCIMLVLSFSLWSWSQITRTGRRRHTGGCCVQCALEYKPAVEMLRRFKYFSTHNNGICYVKIGLYTKRGNEKRKFNARYTVRTIQTYKLQNENPPHLVRFPSFTITMLAGSFLT